MSQKDNLDRFALINETFKEVSETRKKLQQLTNREIIALFKLE